jgi:hypothetical protein
MDPKLLQQIEDYLKSSGLRADELRVRMDAVRNSTVEFNRELLNAQRHYRELSNEFNDLSQTFKNVLDDLRGWNNTSNLINRSFKTLGGLSDKLRYDASEISKLSLKDIRSLEKKANIEKDNLLARKEELDITYQNANLQDIERIAQERGLKDVLKEVAQYRELSSIFDTNNKFKEEENNYVFKLLQLIKEREEKEEKIRKNLGVTGQLYKSIAKTLSDIGFSNDIIEEMGEKLEEAAGKGKVGFKELFPIIKDGFKKALEDPLVKFTIGLKAAKSGINDIKKAFDIFKEFNSIFTETGRSLGMTADQATRMVQNVQFGENAVVGLNEKFAESIYSAKQISQAIGEINNQLGLSVDLGAETIDEFTAMTNQMGLAGVEAANIYKLGKLTNLSLKDTNKAISAQIVAVQKSTGIQLNAKQIFQEIGKLNAGITAKFQQNPELIAKAVAQAKALGLNLEQVDKISESLLNFETSIENELKAELITGKQLNLERARAAALTGDQVTLMNEVASQVGNLEDFNNMNVIAQKSLAEAFGMTRGEMAEMLQQQEIFNKLGDVSGKSAAEQLKIARERGLSEEDSLVVNLKQQAAAEKLAATFDSLKVILADLLTGPFGGLVDAMSSLAKNATLVKIVIGALATLSLAKTIGGFATMAVQLGIMSATAAATASAITLGVGVFAIIAGLASISSAVNDAKKEATEGIPQQTQDGIAPASKGPFTITDKFGATAITTTGDGLAVSPNIRTESKPISFDKEDSIKVPSINVKTENNTNDNGLISTMNDLKNAINSLANKPSPEMSFIVKGEKLGEIVGRQTETGTNQYQNTYRLA